MKSQYISRNKDLAHCITHLSKSGSFAIDLEFDKNRYRYGFNLCLIQIYSNEHCFLIDPLSDHLEIENLFPVLEDPSIEKIVFAFGEDLRLLHSLGCFPQNIFDLKIASSLLNYPPLSLSNILNEILHVDTGKSSQKSNWYKRPLSRKQKQYALNDVLYLPELKEILQSEAEVRGIDSWIQEENASLDQLDYSDLNNCTYIKKRDKNGLSECEWHLYKRLLEYREELAKQFNRPNYQIIDKKYLEMIVRNPEALNDWNSTRGIFRAVRTSNVRNNIAELIEKSNIMASALGLSHSRPAAKPVCREEQHLQKMERNRITQIKSTFFMPIRNKIAEDYGKEAASYMFSNRYLTNMITGRIDSLENYKRRLIEEYARKLNKDIEPLLAVVE